jgi:hypothetical protein
VVENDERPPTQQHAFVLDLALLDFEAELNTLLHQADPHPPIYWAVPIIDADPIPVGKLLKITVITRQSREYETKKKLFDRYQKLLLGYMLLRRHQA